jgi:hypothetical protein
MGLIVRRGTLGGWGFAGTFINYSCRRIYPKEYTISGISRPNYFGFDSGFGTDGRKNRITGQWLPYTINDFVVKSVGGCLEANQLQWNQFDALSGSDLRLYYLEKNNGWAGGYDIPDGSWVIYRASAYVYTTIAHTRGSKWNPPTSGYTFRNGYAGSVTVR